MAWYDLVSFEKNKDSILLIFKFFKLKYGEDFYEVQHWDGTTSMMVKKQDASYKHVYKIILDKEEECAKILERNNANNYKEREEYHVLKDTDGDIIRFFGYDIWYDILNFLFKKKRKQL